MVVLELLARGVPVEEVPTVAGLDDRTYQGYITNILFKLGVNDLNEATEYAKSHGWSQLKENRNEDLERQRLQKLKNLLRAPISRPPRTSA